MGGSSGGSSGAVSYPDYMEAKHSTWLDEVEALITSGVSGDNPYTAVTAYDPDTDLADSITKLGLFNDIVVAFNPDGDWKDLWTVAQNKLEADVFSDALINAKVDAYEANALARFNTSALPRYQRGMQDVRAIMTSAFTVGESLMTADIARDVNTFATTLKRDNELKKTELISNATDKMLAAMSQELEAYKTLTHYAGETNRIKIVAKKEEQERNVKYDVKDAHWDLELYNYGNKTLASIAGAAAGTDLEGISDAQSAIGGAMAGASMGYMVAGASGGTIGGPVGMAVGAAIGGIAGLLMN